MDRIRNTIDLAKTSWGVLQKDRELLLLPVLSFVITLVVFAAFVVPGLLAADLNAVEPTTGEQAPTIPALSYLLFALGGAGAAIVSVFFTGALVAGAHERMSGGDPTISSAIGRAVQRIPGLVPWALLTFTVGVIIRALRERAGWLANLFLGGVEMAFEIAAFLTIPAIVIDEKGAVDGFKTSASLLRATWGENLAARVGFGLLGFVAAIPAIIVGALALASGVTTVIVLGVAVATIWVAVVFATISALGGIFQAALYMYATSGTAPQGFEQAHLSDTFSRS